MCIGFPAKYLTTSQSSTRTCILIFSNGFGFPIPIGHGLFTSITPQPHIYVSHFHSPKHIYNTMPLGKDFVDT